MAAIRAPLRPLPRPALTGAAMGGLIGLALYVLPHGGTLRIGPLSFSDSSLRSLPFHLGAWPVLIGAGAAIGGVIGVVGEIRRQGRAALMEEVAAKMGMEYSRQPPPALISEWAQLIGERVKVDHHHHGTLAEASLDIVDVTQTHSSQDAEGHPRNSSTRRTVCCMPADGLPEFTLSPGGLLHRFVSALRLAGMSFNPRALNSRVDRAAVAQFAASWQLSVRDAPVATASVAADGDQRESSVRKLFTTGLMRSLEAFRRDSVEVKCGRLLVWRGTGVCSPKERESLAAAAVQLRALLLGALNSPQGVEVPSLPGESRQVRTRRIAGATIGGGLGAAAGFFGGFGLFCSFVMEHDDLAFSGAAPLLFFGLPLAGAAVTGLAGTIAGSRLGRYLRLEDLAGLATNRPQGGWDSAGMFSGFVLGAMASLGIIMLGDHIVGLNRIPVWLIAPLFFAGPITGLVGGSIVGSRLREHRALKERNADGKH